jgi:hypothetical protein
MLFAAQKPVLHQLVKLTIAGLVFHLVTHTNQHIALICVNQFGIRLRVPNCPYFIRWADFFNHKTN